MDVAKQIAAFFFFFFFFFFESVDIVTQVLPVQQQANCVDCGLFEIDFATSLAHNENPVRRVTAQPNQTKATFGFMSGYWENVGFPSHNTNEKKKT